MLEALLALGKKIVTVDPYLSSVLMAFDATVDATIKDLSPYNRVITGAGSPPIVAGQGIHLTSTSQYLSTPYAAEFTLPGDFTLETSFNATSRASSYPSLFGNYSVWTTNGSLGLFIGHQNGDTTRWSVALNGTFPVMKSVSQITYGMPLRVALTRQGRVYTLYINGVAETTYTAPADITIVGTANTIWMGLAGDQPASSTLNGYYRKFRLTKGVARTLAEMWPT